jgi:hypothetical protein
VVLLRCGRCWGVGAQRLNVGGVVAVLVEIMQAKLYEIQRQSQANRGAAPLAVAAAGGPDA